MSVDWNKIQILCSSARCGLNFVRSWRYYTKHSSYYIEAVAAAAAGHPTPQKGVFVRFPRNSCSQPLSYLKCKLHILHTFIWYKVVLWRKAISPVSCWLASILKVTSPFHATDYARTSPTHLTALGCRRKTTNCFTYVRSIYRSRWLSTYPFRRR